jgi:hypothetical protein
MLSFSLVCEPMLIPAVRDEEGVEDLCTDDWFWAYERSVDVIFIYSYVHLFRKLYIYAYGYKHKVTWKNINERARKNLMLKDNFMLPENNLYTIYTLYFFTCVCLYTAFYLFCGRFYNRLRGNQASLFSFMYIFSYLLFPFLRRPFSIYVNNTYIYTRCKFLLKKTILEKIKTQELMTKNDNNYILKITTKVINLNFIV